MNLTPINLIRPEHLLVNPKNIQVTGKTLPGLDVIGKGYDVRNEYAKISSVYSQPLFKFGNATEVCEVMGRRYVIPPVFSNRVINQPSTSIKFCTGKSLDEYKRSLSVNVSVSGSYGFFSGSVKTNFREDDFTSIGYEYATLIDVQQLFRISLPPSQQLKQYLLPEVKNLLDNPSIDPLNVFNTYGAFYLGEIIMGGRLDYSSTTKTFKWNHSSDLSVVAHASFNALVASASANVSTQITEDVKHFQENSTLTLYAVGGSPDSAARVAIESIKKLPDWSATLMDYPSLVDFTPNSLRPIWELCSSPARQEQLRNALGSYMSFSPTVNIKNQLLRVSLTPPMAPAGADHGSGANKDVSVYKPYVSGNWGWAGQYAQGNYSPCSGHSISIEDIYDLGLLKPPIDFNCIWNDKGSGKPKDYSCWRPIPPEGYAALGDLMRLAVDDQGAPRGPEILGLVCVREEFTVPFRSLGPELWNDRGSHADHDVTLFKVVPPPNGVDAGTFAGYPQYTNNPSRDLVELSCLTNDRSKVDIRP